MDFAATISRAFKIVRENRVLWVLGFLTALGSATSFGSGSGNGSGYQVPATTSGATLPDWFTRPGVLAAGIGALLLFAVVLGLALYVISVIARGGLIAGVRVIETEGKTTFKSAWSAGAAKFWSLLGMSLLLFLPFIIIGVIALIILATSGLAIFAPLIGGDNMPQSDIVAGGVVMAVLVLTMGCAAVVYGLVAMGIQTLGERAIVLDNQPVLEAVRKAWRMFRAQLGNIILLALLMFLINLAVSIVTGFIVALLFLPTVATLINSQTPQTATYVLGILGLVAAIVVGALIGSVFSAFNSAVWTLTYEQFNRNVAVTPAPTAPTLTPTT